MTAPAHPSPKWRSILWLLAAAYAAVGIAVMLLASPKVPYADPWRFLATFLELPFPQNVLATDNGHREVLPNLVRVAELHAFAANQWLQIGAGAALVAAAAVALLAACRGTGPTVRAAAVAIACTGIYWLGNARKLAHGNESVHLGLVLLCLATGVRMLASPPGGPGRGRVAAASLLGILATLSFGSGIACFAAYAAVLGLQRAPLRDWLGLGGGGALAAVLLLLGGGAAVPFGLDPLAQGDLLLRWLGAPSVWALSPLLDPDHAARLPGELLRQMALAVAEPVHAACGPPLPARWPALGFGALGLAWLFGASWRLRRRGGTAPERVALGLAWFGAAVGLLVVTVRLQYFGLHPEQVTSQRYLPWSMVFWTGLLLGSVLRPGRSGRTAAAVAFAFAAVLAPSQVWTGRNAWKQLRTAELTALGAAVGVLDRDFPLVETMPADLLRAVPLLRRAGVAMFAWPETRALGTVPPPERLEPVAVHDVAVQSVQNLFAGPDGASVWFAAAQAGPTRLVLLDAAGTVRGLAWCPPFATQWQGWLRGLVEPAEMRAAVLR